MQEKHTTVKVILLMGHLPHACGESGTDPFTSLSWLDLQRHNVACGYVNSLALEDANSTLMKKGGTRSINTNTLQLM